ncbi:hypothetical protein ACQ4PT_051078 [Festuca glaucescens]
MELSGITQFSESPEISLGEEEAVEQETDGLEEDLARMAEEAGNPDQDAGPNLAAYTRGAWKGSDVSQAEIDWLYRSRRIPEEVFCRIPGKEREPTPEPGEVVVFTAHFERGFSPHRRRGAEIFCPKRLYEDDEDPDPYMVGNVHKMGPTHSRRPGNTPAPRSPRAQADAPGSEDDDCIMLEVFDPLPFSYALSAMSVSADQDRQVLEHATPLSAEVGDPPDSRVRKASAPEAGSSGAPAPKRQKVASSGPPRKKKRNAIPTSSGTSSSAATKSPSPTKGAAVPPPASGSKPPPAPRQSSRKGTEVTAEQLSAAVTAAAAPPTSSQGQALVLHAGRAAITAGEKVSAQLGRIVELNRGDANLGGLQRYVDKWNVADLTDATLGVGKDKKLVIDSRGPRSTVQHLGRLKHAVKEFDNAWHDANNNVLGVLDSRKQLFEELLWEHRDLTEAFASLKLTHSQCQAVLPEASLDNPTSQVASLKAEKEEMSLQHQQELKAQREETANLKDQLIQAGLQHARALKEAIAAGEAKVEEAKKQFADAEEQLRRELEEEKKLQQQEQERNDALLAVQVSLDEMIKDVDDKALKFFPDSQVRAAATVAKARANESIDANAPWTTKDRLAALYSRISHMRIIDRHLAHLPDAATKALKCLWPGEAVPENVSTIADWLLETGKRLSEWRHSAARAGADTALRFACSWYEDLDLDALHSMRGDAPTDTDPARTAARRDRAYRIACYASTSTFIPPPADLEEEFTDDEEEEEEAGDDEATEEEAVVNAPEEPAAGNPEPASEEPVAPEQAPESSSPLYQ